VVVVPTGHKLYFDMSRYLFTRCSFSETTNECLKGMLRTVEGMANIYLN